MDYTFEKNLLNDLGVFNKTYKKKAKKITAETPKKSKKKIYEEISDN